MLSIIKNIAKYRRLVLLSIMLMDSVSNEHPLRKSKIQKFVSIEKTKLIVIKRSNLESKPQGLAAS